MALYTAELMFGEFYDALGFLQILSTIAGIAAFICWILILVAMFQNGRAGWAIFCIITAVLCGIGYLITFLYGWFRCSELRVTNIMLFWTLLLAIQWLPILYVLKYA
jgi:hypothetical protein